MAKRSRAGSASSEASAGGAHADAAAAEPAAPHVVKYVHVDSPGSVVSAPAVMKCQLPGHRPLGFATYEEYDVHYRQTHVNRCSECKKNFPSETLLGLHLAETHDPINEARKARGEKIYACFAEACDKKCSTPSKRRMHMVAKHHFPEDYDFAIIKDGIDGRSSMLRSSRNDVYSRKPKKSAVEKARDRAEGPASADKKPAKTHIVFSEDGSTPQNITRASEKKQDASDRMEIVEPKSDQPPAVGSTKDVEMVSPDAHVQAIGLSASKHATKHTPTKGPRQTQQQAAAAKDKDGRGGTTAGADDAARDGTASSAHPAGDVSGPDPMEGLARSMSSLRFVPPSIRFGRGGGRGRGRGGFAKG